MERDNQWDGLDEQVEPHTLIETFEAKCKCQVIGHAEEDDIENDLGAKTPIGDELTGDWTTVSSFSSRPVHIDVIEKDAKEGEPN